MEDSFKLLEDKIERAAQRLKEFHSESSSLRDALAEAQSRAQKAEKRLGAGAGSDGASAGTSKEVKDMAREIREYFIPDFSNWKDHDSFEESYQRLMKDFKPAPDDV